MTESRGQHRLRRLFVVLETGVAALLLVESGLLIKSFAKASSISPGFQTSDLITLQISLPESRYGRPGNIGSFVSNAVQRIRSISGVQAAAIGTNLPFLGSGLSSILIQGKPLARNHDSQFVQFNPVSPGYFGTLRIPMLRGRDFAFRDTADSVPVAIVNQAFADRFFCGTNSHRPPSRVFLRRSALENNSWRRRRREAARSFKRMEPCRKCSRH